MIGLPPLIGYLAAGFSIAASADYQGLSVDSTSALQHIAHLGVLLLLFTVGLKLKVKMFWSTKSRHFVFTILILNRTHITVSSMKPFQVVIAHIRRHILSHFFTRSVMHF